MDDQNTNSENSKTDAIAIVSLILIMVVTAVYWVSGQ